MTVAFKPQPHLYTVDDLDQMPSECRYELIKGELREMPPPPGDAHGNTSMRFSAPFASFVFEHELGECHAAETGFLVARNPDTVKAPDFAFIAKERVPALSTKHLPLAPDLVLETRSPSDTQKMMSDKMQEWLDAGVRMALELNLRKRVLTVYEPGKEPVMLGIEDTFSGGDVLPGFMLLIKRLFRDTK